MPCVCLFVLWLFAPPLLPASAGHELQLIPVGPLPAVPGNVPASRVPAPGGRLFAGASGESASADARDMAPGWSLQPDGTLRLLRAD